MNENNIEFTPQDEQALISKLDPASVLNLSKLHKDPERANYTKTNFVQYSYMK